MIAFPAAKINLGLNIIRKREDGYHDLSTCFYPIPFCDILEVLPAEKTTLEITGVDIPGTTESNLCLKAWQLLHKSHRIRGVQIHLHKIIPTGAGLGGGSSDAASMLITLNTIFELGLPIEALETLALSLGSDCPFFIHSKPMLAEGRGEKFAACNVSLAGKYLVLVCPNIHVSTSDAFHHVVPRTPELSIPLILDSTPIHQWKHVLVNDFEVSVFQRYPELSAIKARLYAAGALYASMSGSGSSVFGIFDEPPALTDIRIAWQGYLTA